jgi:alpha-2-macroglobulin
MKNFLLHNKKITIAAVGMLAVTSAAAWWFLGSDSRGKPLGEATASEQFEALDCQSRFFENSPALALMFSAPVDGKQRLKELITVHDLGEIERDKNQQRDDENNRDKKSKATANPPAKITSKETADAEKSTIVATPWVVGDNPRILYLPNASPKHRYRVTLASELASTSRTTLGENLACEIKTDAMSPTFYFASKGVVLPAKQNGGLPIITINVPEVDVQFLRVEPAQLPRFLSRISGNRNKRDASSLEDNNDESEYGYAEKRAPQGLVQSYELDQLRKMSKSVYLGRFLADARVNRRNVTHLPVEDIKELQEPGIYIAVMSEPGRFNTEFQTTYFYVSDIGIHTRRYPNAIEAYATSLKTGRALSGVAFQLLDDNGKPLASAESDGDGRARFDVKSNLARVVTAKRGQEFSLLSLIEPALDLSEFDTSGHLARPIKIFAYAGRDLYRPGESLQVSVLVRDADGAMLPAAPLTATLKRADGKVVQQFSLPFTQPKLGYLQKTIQLPQDAQTGTWTLEFRADPAAKVADHTMKIQVEEFLPERMKLDLKSEQATLKVGDEFVIDVKGDYLYGAPAAGNRVLTTVATERARIPFPKEWPGVEYGDFDDDKLKKRDEIADSVLDDEGRVAITVPMQETKPASPLNIRAMVSLLESGGRPVVRTIERTLWPMDKMIGVRPLWSGKFIREGTPAEFEVIRTTRDAKFAPLSKATLRVFREDRDYYWVFDDERGWHSGFNDGNELVESREFDLSQRAKVTFPVKWGRYRIEIADSQTGAVMRYRFYAGWGAEDAERLGSRPDRVALKLDKANYKVGDTAKLTINPPHDGEALVLVEGDKALYQRRVAVSATGTTINLPIGRDWNRHDLYVSAVVFRPGSKSEKITPARAMGLTHLAIDREARRLNVVLDAPKKIEPESVMKVKVKVTGAVANIGNEPSFVTISAVDIGILNITRYPSPDAFDFFFGKQRYQADALDLYGKFIETMEGKKGQLKFGGDANMRDQKKSPQKVKLVDLFSGAVMLNAAGEAVIDIAVPDFNGTLKLMAVVASPTQFGKAEAEVVSAAAIVAELATPRFISPGDRAAIALDVTNMTAVNQDFNVRVSAKGPIRIIGAAESVSLKPQQKKTLRMSAEATDAAGDGIITVEVKGSTDKKPISIKRESVLAISPLQPQERTRRFQRVQPGETFKLDANMIDGYFAGSALMSATLSTTPPIDVKSLTRDLFAYPYGCLEQTTSRAFPFVLLDDALTQSFGLKTVSRPEREKAVADAVSRLSGMQRSTGAFNMWGEGPDEPWLTAYVMDFLKSARDAGYAVPEPMLKRADEWMLKQLQQAGGLFPAKPTTPKKVAEAKEADAISRDAAYWSEGRNRELGREGHRRLGALAYMGYVLSREERAPLAALRDLYDNHRDRSLSSLPLVQLGIALQRMGDTKRAAGAFDLAMALPYGMTGDQWEWLGDYGTRLRDNALSYALLEKHKIVHKRSENLVAELMTEMPRARYLSTQEQFALIRAAASFIGPVNDKSEKWSATISEGAKVIPIESHHSAMREFDAATLKRGASVTNNGKAAIYVAIEASGYPLKPREAKDDVIRLKRTLYNPDATPVGDRVLKVGEQLLVHLEVTSNRRIEDGLIIDRIPAGLEIENLNLSQGNRLAEFKTPKPSGLRVRQPKEIADSLADERVKHREFRDDRYVAAVRIEGTIDLYYLVRVVTPGQFIVPPSMAEDMYRPEVRGLTAASGTVTVVDRK